MLEEEHQLWERESAGDATDADQRLAELRVSLDQCWDLLRQRRDRRDAGLSPESAELRSPDVVERYSQSARSEPAQGGTERLAAT